MIKEKILKLQVDEERSENVNSSDQPEIFKLNDICLIHIFSFLPIPERIRIQRVCKRWQKANTLSWCDMKELDIGDGFNGFLNQTFKCDKLHFSILRQVLQLCGPCLTHIRLTTIDSTPNKKLLVLVKEMCPNLKSIDFCLLLCRRTMRLIADNFDTLRQCTFRYCYANCEDILSIFLSRNKNLQSLHLHSFKAKGSCMDNLPVESLKHIAITHCNQFLPENLINLLQNVDALESLSIENSKKIVMNMNDILRLAPEQLKLKIFKIQSQRRPGRKLVHLSYMHKFTNLHTLELWGSDVLHNEILLNVGEYCKNLKRAVLGWSNRVTDLGIKFITNLPKLSYLELDNISKITNKVIPYLLELKSIKFMQCDRIDYRGICLLMEISKNLEQLDVDCWSGLNVLIIKNEIKKIRVSTKPLKLSIKGEIIEF